jgi:hypothetical protein
MNELAIREEPLTAVEVRAQVNLIQEVMEAVMKKDLHFGTIPGTQKPTLYKPGSEKLLSTFRISIHPEVEDLSFGGDVIRYRVTCKAYALDGSFLGAGVGECSTDEDKYKWRGVVCDAEWDATPETHRRIKYGKKQGGYYEAKQVRTNPADLANTVLKMAKKRAQIDVTLTVTAASDIFEQDIDDLPPEVRESIVGRNGNDKPATEQPQRKSKASQGKSSGDSPQDTLKAELEAYCGDDLDKQREVLKQISIFTNDKGEEVWIKGAHTINKVSDKWAGSALGKLRKLVEEGGGQATPEGWTTPKDCTTDPKTCAHSGWAEGVAYCGPDGPECPYLKKDK